MYLLKYLVICVDLLVCLVLNSLKFKIKGNLLLSAIIPKAKKNLFFLIAKWLLFVIEINIMINYCIDYFTTRVKTKLTILLV